MGLFRRWAINILFLGALAVYGAGLLVDIMEVDAAQYASLSREMAETGSYLEVYHRGNDYLDKPPLLFWVSSFWIDIFGPHNWTYKLSSFLFSILGIISTYKLGHLLYNKRIGFVAAIMLATSQAYFLFNHDVRTDTILTSAVIFAVWQIMAFIFYRERMHLIGGFFGIGLGMLAKGPIALMVPFLAFASYFIGRKRYKDFFQWEWLMGLAIVAIMLSPMLYGLYTQFDQHPEKEIVFMSDAGNRTETEVSGVKFYLWTQSFGRLTGENVWSDGSPPTYFVDTFLWSFLPWSILAVWALLWRLGNTAVDVIKRRKKQEWLTLGGFVLPFIAFSLSQYKLPHYIFVLFPFAAIITAEFVLRVLYEKPTWWGNVMWGIQSVNVIAIGAVATILLTYVFPTGNAFIFIIFGGLMAVSLASLFSRTRINQIVLSSALAIIAANWVMNTHFYPELFKYQAGKWAANWVDEHEIPKERIFIYPSFGFFSFEYYANHTFYNVDYNQIEQLLENGQDVWIYVKDDYVTNLENKLGRKTEVLASFPAFHISLLTIDFLNPATRDEQLSEQHLVKISAK
jgi:4-amino-4-deoxy-L-arabinose transferase-like glycosyltransferase